MAGQPDSAGLREELATIEDEIREAESALQQLREESDGPVDSAEQAQRLTLFEEQDSLVGNLRNRRDELQRRLTAS